MFYNCFVVSLYSWWITVCLCSEDFSFFSCFTFFLSFTFLSFILLYFQLFLQRSKGFFFIYSVWAGEERVRFDDYFTGACTLHIHIDNNKLIVCERLHSSWLLLQLVAKLSFCFFCLSRYFICNCSKFISFWLYCDGDPVARLRFDFVTFITPLWHFDFGFGWGKSSSPKCVTAHNCP